MAGKRAPTDAVPNAAAELKARLAAADRYDRRVAARQLREAEIRKDTAQRFAKIAGRIPVVDPEQWQGAITKAERLPPVLLPPAPPSKSMRVKAWLEEAVVRFPQNGQSIKAWSRRLFAEASKEGMSTTAGSIETRIHEWRREERRKARATKNATK
jgi:hypothetical protein